MASERQIKRRIKSAKNISQITRAMQMVAASKMKKAQSVAIAGRPYAEKIAEMVKTFASGIDKSKHPLLKTNTVGKTLIILVSTNKGLLGGLNTSLFRSFLRKFSDADLEVAEFVTIGKKGEQFLVRTGRKLAADFSNSTTFTVSIPPVTQFLTEGYIKGQYKEIYIVYSNFISALKQEPTIKKLLPITAFDTELESKKTEKEIEFLVEPSIEHLLDPLLVSYLENQVRDAISEAEASEHSARMIAMKNATDNALEFVSLLTLEYNKARQEKITYEIADMITARSAFE